MTTPEEQYHFVGVGWPRDYGVLPREPAAQYDELLRTISDRWPVASRRERETLDGAGGVLERLANFLLQVKRIAEHAGHLSRQPPIAEWVLPGAAVALQSAEVCADFESLLFHGRAALDRLALFVSGFYSQKSDRFPALSNILRNFQHKDSRAAKALAILSKADNLPGVLMDIHGSRSLRSLVAHRISVVEGTSNVFTLHRLPDGRVLIFDCEALGCAVLNTSHSVAGEVPFIVSNVVAIYLDVTPLPDIVAFKPEWLNPTVVFTDHVDPTQNGPEFFVVAFKPDGFRVTKQRLKASVLDLARRTDER